MSTNANDVEQIPLATLENVLGVQPFAADVIRIEMVSGTRLKSTRAVTVVARLKWREELCTAGGKMHGGCMMATADAVGATCGLLSMPPNSNTTTVESKTNFFRGVTVDDQITITATTIHIGRSFVVIQTDLVSLQTGKLIARTTQTQMVMEMKM